MQKPGRGPRFRRRDHSDISIIASNADNWYDAKNKTYPDRDLDGSDDRAEAAATGGGIGALAAAPQAF